MESMGDILSNLTAKINQFRVAQSDGYQANSDTKTYECAKCRDEEGFIVREDGREVWRRCECAEKKRLARMFKSSRITDEFRKKTFDNFKLEGRPEIVRHAFNASRAYIQNFEKIKGQRRNSIALLGNPGCGKTHLLMAISNHLLIEGIPVLYFPWVEGFNEIKDNLDLLEEKVNRMQRVEVLYIDDLFKGRRTPTDFQIEQLFAIINHRYLNNMPILVSSEKDIDDICEIDEGIGSRINEMCKSFRVVLRGDKHLNYRLED